MQKVDIYGSKVSPVASFRYSVPAYCRARRAVVTLHAAIPELGLKQELDLGNQLDGVAQIEMPDLAVAGTFRFELFATAGACFVDLSGDVTTVVIND